MESAAPVPPSRTQKPADALASLSVLQLHGEHDSACGYCDGKTGRFSYGVVASTLTCVDYQALIDGGWRRSGTYMYHPCNQKTCCPNLTIRLDAEKFQPNKQQRRVLRRFQQFLAGEELDAAEAGSGGAEGAGAVRGRSAPAPTGLRADGGSTLAGTARRPSAADLKDPLHAFLSDLLLAAAAPMLTVASFSEAPASLAPAVAAVKSAAAAQVCGVKPAAASSLPMKLHGLLRSRAAKATKPADAAGATGAAGALLPSGTAGDKARVPPAVPPTADADASTRPVTSSGSLTAPAAAAAVGVATTPLELGRALASRVCDVYASWATSLTHAAPGDVGAEREPCLQEDVASKQWIARLVPPAAFSSASAAALCVAGASVAAPPGRRVAPPQAQDTASCSEQGAFGTILLSVAHTGHINFAFPHGGTFDIRRGCAAARALDSVSEKAGAGEDATAALCAWLPVAAASLPAAPARSRSPGPRTAGGAGSKAAVLEARSAGTAAAEPSATSSASGSSSAGAGAAGSASPAAKRARRSQDAADVTGDDMAAEVFAVQAEESAGESGGGDAVAGAVSSGTAGSHGGRQKAKGKRGPAGAGDTTSAGAGAAAAGGKPVRSRTFTVTTVPAAFDREAYALYRRYQMAVHGDEPAECSEKQYTRFLCDSALRREPFPPTAARASAETPAVPVMGVVSGSSAGSGSGAGAGRPAARGAASAEDWWSSPGGRAVARCVAGEAAAWRDGEGGGAGLPVTAGVSQAKDSAAGSPSTGALSSSAAAAAGSCVAADSASSGAKAPDAAAARPSSTPHLPRELRFDLFDDPAAAEQHDGDMHLGYGSFHQHYRIDGKLVAVGVVDILPHCLSSVYVYYDPEVSKQLELGKLTALWELQWVQHVRAHVSPRLRYYYMGFYVRSCQKMRYKGEYAPSDLLCPHTWRWVPLADCAPLLDADKYAILDPAARAAPSLITDERRQRLAAAAGAVPATPVFLRRVHADSLVLLRDLTEEGRRIVKEALLGLFERCTPELARRLAVQF